MRIITQRTNRGLTLLELVVVIAILVALAGLITPLIADLPRKSGSIAKATIVADTDRAVQLFDSRFKKQPSGWDSLLNSNDGFYSKLNPLLTDANPPILQVFSLDAGQAKSLLDVGISSLYDADETRSGAPSNNSTVLRSIANSTKVVALVKTPIVSGHGSTVIDAAFGINQFNVNWANEFVVFGLGGATSLKGTTMTEIPFVQTTDPSTSYSRALCVYMIPAAGAASVFPAQFMGTFLPDGTSLRHNVDDFNTNEN